MQIFRADLAITGADGVGLRATIAVTQVNPNAKIAPISKVHPMRSHTIVAEGGFAAVAQDRDSFDYHFHDTVADEDWLCEQDVVDYFAHHYPIEMVQLEQWGCSWNRHEDGGVSIRCFGGMEVERTRSVTGKTGFRILYTLFQTPLQFPQIQRFDEHFVLDTPADDGCARGLVAMNMMEGTLAQICANAVVMATGGADRVYRYNTNGGVITDDGMGMTLSHGIPLCDMEFVQCYPIDLSGSDILMTEGCRGEGGILVNKNSYRYLQSYNVGPETPLGEPKNRYMEPGPRGKVSQVFWYEWRKDNTIPTPRSDAVHLDLRRLGEKELLERLPFICELAKAYAGVDPVKEPIPIHPTARYTMGDIEIGQHCETRIRDLFTVGGCSSVGLHGANHPDSSSLAELVIFGYMADEQTVEHAATTGVANSTALDAQVAGVEKHLKDLVNQEDNENWSKIRDKMGLLMEEGYGVYRTPGLMQKTVDKLTKLQERFKRVCIIDIPSASNIGLLYTIKLGHGLNVVECMAHSVLACKKSHDVHRCLDEGCTERDDVSFLKHVLVFRDADGATRLEYSDVKITTLPLAKRVCGGEAEAADKKGKANS